MSKIVRFEVNISEEQDKDLKIMKPILKRSRKNLGEVAIEEKIKAFHEEYPEIKLNSI